ncbi:formylglycine-generating enzyme family protein [Fibrobacter sp. UWB11]|uniref:formylglycine-generating enzyme family protein n=1 Tax=Fibrobacter sp. UWB11 TaxID=1896202 RepID=UPI0009299184|nr:formylglycine-generating enzyme family protein [Fibrobacter sp. UWB11]SIO40623.1 Formylglycine-generating enzyme, required for sulfatase activity, contains SUMF1/FGE domain [Fibrobacter sp. UWB11]
MRLEQILSHGVSVAVLSLGMCFALGACTASGESVEGEAIIPSDNGRSSPVNQSSSSKGSPQVDSTVFTMFEWSTIPKATITRGVNSFGVNSFAIATTEVTQKTYEFVMNSLPKQLKSGENRAVSDVDWFRAALFCNAFSKLVGLDTAYVYKSIAGDSSLVDLTINYSVASIRLPTENEWEVAARGGTSTTYYWDTDVATKYAYYGQTTGPDEVAQKLPNAFGLYDMAGNVAEWVNDWYDTYPKNGSNNYAGPKTGDFRVIRGGGWSDKVTALAPKEREKLNPAQSKVTIGFRLVYSTGF